MEYNLTLNNRAFNAIKEGRKKVEIRANKLGENQFDHSILQIGDSIYFTSYNGDIIKCEIILINWYPTIEDLLTKEGTKYTLSSTDDFDKGVKSINSLDGYKEAIRVNGVYAIHIKYLY